jgi:hypothetical protein
VVVVASALFEFRFSNNNSNGHHNVHTAENVGDVYDLSYLGADTYLGAEGALVLAGYLKVNTSVTSIYLGGAELGTAGATALADALRVNAAVTRIVFGDNRIGVGV